MNRKTLIPITVLLIALTAGYIIQTVKYHKAVLTRAELTDYARSYADTLAAEYVVGYLEKIVTQDSCCTLAELFSDLNDYARKQWYKYEAEVVSLRPFLPDSVVVIDGILYERALQSRTASNNGVGTPTNLKALHKD